MIQGKSNTLSVQLEEVRFAARTYITEELLRDGIHGGSHALQLTRDFALNGYVLEIKSRFWAQKRDFDLPPIPLTWWDHFKRDAIPTFTRWLHLRVREKRETLRAITIFPDLPQIQGGRYYYIETRPTEYMTDPPEES